MALYAIGDLHLSLSVNKPMDVFGGAWDGYMEKLNRGLSVIGPEDTTVLPGDLSWAMSLEQAQKDFAYIAAIPGRKIILKGNHDYWWTTAAKFDRFCAENGFEQMYLLNNNAYFYGDYAICGSRGWFCDEQGGAHDEKILNRELMRLEASFQAAQGQPIFCFLHYPPRYRGYCCEPLCRLLQRYQVRLCCYGHLHAESHALALQGLWEGTDYRLVSADYLHFAAAKLLD